VAGTFELATPRTGSVRTVDRVVEALDGACRAAGVQRRKLHHVMIGTPGAFDPGTRQLRYARHLPGWHDAEMLPKLRHRLGLDVHVENDVNLAAVAEQSLGVASRSDDFVLLWCDEGVGAAVVIDGRLHRGFRGGAGEVGFLPVPGTQLVRNVTVSNAGGYQELVGAKAVVALAREHGIRSSTATAAVTAARKNGHERFLIELGQRLAVGLAAIVAVLDPELVVLAGGILHAGGDPLLREVELELHDLTVARPTIALSEVSEDPVLLGALHTALVGARDAVFKTTEPSNGGRNASD
jgi:predicted NBD/HSP70 family sugar kinase